MEIKICDKMNAYLKDCLEKKEIEISFITAHKKSCKVCSSFVSDLTNQFMLNLFKRG